MCVYLEHHAAQISQRSSKGHAHRAGSVNKVSMEIHGKYKRLFVCLFSTSNKYSFYSFPKAHTFFTCGLPPNFDSKDDRPCLHPRCSQATQTLLQMLWKLEWQICRFILDRGNCRHWDCCEEALTGEIGETSEMELGHTLRNNAPGNFGANIMLVPLCAMIKAQLSGIRSHNHGDLQN